MTLPVSCQSVSRQYRRGEIIESVLADVTLNVAAGESVALLGRSGSGKSTLLNVVAGLDNVDGGQVLIGDFAISDDREPERTMFRAKNIGFVFQSFNLLPTLSVRDNIHLMLDLAGCEVQDASSRIDDALASVGLSDAASCRPDTLSGGEQQRVAIARALVHQPGLILADEPTGNLDSRNADRIADLLLERVRRSAATLMLATHSHALAARCDRQVDVSRLSQRSL
ncbi:MAG: ABC transporter ATP-binding protein [Pseudomonadota bacterium]